LDYSLIKLDSSIQCKIYKASVVSHSLEKNGHEEIMDIVVVALVLEGDIIIRTRDGAFIIVHCSEEIARELFIGPEECDYLVNDQWFKILVGIALSMYTDLMPAEFVLS
jgi:hypothetical protein